MPQFILSVVRKHLDCFHFQAILNHAAMNTLEPEAWGTCACIPVGYKAPGGILSHGVYMNSTLEENTKLLSK